MPGARLRHREIEDRDHNGHDEQDGQHDLAAGVASQDFY
jgi:hypothetical protein